MMKASFIYLAAITASGFIGQEASAVHLRASNTIQRRKAAYRDFDFFECDIFETAGVADPGEEDELALTLTCETDPDHEFGDVVFSLEGDTDKLLYGLDLSHGDVRIKVPVNAVSDHDIIEIDEKSSKQITITHTGDDDRRKLNSSNSFGNKFVLVIRVSDDSDSSGRKKVAQSASKLSEDIFDWRNNNLKMVYKKCSNSQLSIRPADGNKVIGGVIDLVAPSNICSMTYTEVGNWALKHEDVTPLLGSEKVTHKMIIMPNKKQSNGNGCVDFGRGAAWGQVNGDTTWFQSASASYPAVQVHEFGHNFGMKHSGAPDNNGNYKSYADGNGYMGNKAIWNEEGSAMCFNAAKMWYFEWWSNYHKIVEPSTTVQSVKLIPLADLKKDKYVSGANMLLKLQSTDQSDLYITFNRAKGVNEGVRADANKVVITEQNGRTAVSIWKAALVQGGIYRQSNWGDTGKTLIIKVADIIIGDDADADTDTADVQIYFESFSQGKTDECTDFVPSGKNEWYDADGSDFNCQWYSQNGRCTSFGDKYANFGKTANMACCACEEVR